MWHGIKPPLSNIVRMILVVYNRDIFISFGHFEKSSNVKTDLYTTSNETNEKAVEGGMQANFWSKLWGISAYNAVHLHPTLQPGNSIHQTNIFRVFFFNVCTVEQVFLPEIDDRCHLHCGRACCCWGGRRLFISLITVGLTSTVVLIKHWLFSQRFISKC